MGKNKVTIFYITSSVLLFFLLIGGGCYGIYISVGLSFVRNGVSNIVDGVAQNVSFGGTVNFSYSMMSVIILSIGLIILSIFDFILLIKQIVFFKQFRIIKDSNLEKGIENKVKNKSSIVFFAIVIDLISFAVGIIGIVINMQTFPNKNVSIPLFVIDGLVSLFAVISIVLLTIKLKSIKKNKKRQTETQKEKVQNDNKNKENNANFIEKTPDIDKIEYQLLKLKYLKSSKIINLDEYDKIRKAIIIGNDDGEITENNK